ncbi:hypothetical protein PV458_27005 [Streptomyces sp. MN03-5084-2B]|nr:hypothetical protein [Streptomyces sp. MN03-5084-2B]
MLLPRLLKAAVSAASVAVTTMAQLNLPNAGFWSNLKPLMYLAVAGLVSVVVAEVVGAVVGRLQMPRVRGYDQELRAVLSAGISQLELNTTAHWRQIGISAYYLRGHLWWRRLVLVDTLQLGSGPKHGVRWRPGRSVIGAAYQQQVLLSEDWESYFKLAESAGPAAWRARSELERYGLTWGQLMRTKALVSITACPVFGEDGTLNGVVCAEAPANLSTEHISGTMQDIANAVGDLGAPPASWWGYVGRRIG